MSSGIVNEAFSISGDEKKTPNDVHNLELNATPGTEGFQNHRNEATPNGVVPGLHEPTGEGNGAEVLCAQLSLEHLSLSRSKTEKEQTQKHKQFIHSRSLPTGMQSFCKSRVTVSRI